MIEIPADLDFEEMVREFLMMDEEKRLLVGDRLETILSALDWAIHLDETQTTH